MYLRCPRQYWFRYVEGKKEPPKIALLEGSAHHEAMQENNNYKKAKGKDLKASTITESFMASLRVKTEQEERVEWEDEDENKLFRRAKVWHEDYVAHFAPKIKPEIVEETFEKEVSMDGLDFILKGIIDLGYAKTCSDYKTTSSYGLSRKKQEIDSDLQLSYYSWATGYKLVENICFVKKENPEVVPIRSSRSKTEITWALKVAAEVAKAIASEAFPMCNPTSWLCAEKWCGFYSMCRGKK
jgi:CRISPR/Cas system-associated exonuclease Cas4 (RecB family)